MILRGQKRKANGSPTVGYWYVTGEALDDGFLHPVISENLNKAKFFATKAEAEAFNKKHGGGWEIAK